MSDDRRVDVTFGAKIAGLVAGAREAAAVVKESTLQMKESGEGVVGVFALVQKHWAMLLGVIAGGALFKEAIQSTVEWTSEIVMLSKRLGITTEEASGLAVALHHVGVGADEYGGLVSKLTRQMRTNEQAFETLGLRTKEQDGQWRNSQALMADVIEKLNGMKAGTDRNVAAQALLGARVGNLTPLLRLNAEMLQESAEKAERYHLVVGPDGAKKVRAYKDAMADLHLIGKSLAVQLGNALLPVVLNLAQALGDVGPRAAGLFAKAIKFVALAALEGYAAVNALAQSSLFLKTLMATEIGKGWLTTVTAAWHHMGEEVTRVNEKVQDGLLRINGFGGAKPTRSAAPTGETLGGDTLGKDKKGGSDSDGRLAAWKDELNQIKAADELGKDTLLVDEISFWQAKLRTIQGNAKADVKLRQQINAELLAADNQLHADELATQRIHIQARRDESLEALDIQKQDIQQRAALGQIDRQETEQRLAALNQAVLAIKLQALEEDRALAMGNQKELAAIDERIIATKRASASEMAAIGRQTTVDIAADWDALFGQIGTVMERTINGMITGTQSLRQSLKSIFQNIVLDFAASKLKQLQHHIAGELAMRGITTATAAHKILTESWAALKSIAIAAASAIKKIAVFAAEAAAGAYSALVSIPYVGPVLAPIAAGVALAGVLALGSKVASASGGYDIPAGINPVTQLHAEEMVLPASLANAVRAMVSGGDSGGRDRGQGGDTINLTVNALDAKSFRDYARSNPEAFAAGVHSAIRNGHLSRKI
ncbi:MAG: hypothetical protein JWL95_1154 [Gemmatimonadetes bacterium]|nr:hypothetical protein [Gemmatimonadota bacterium]